MEGGAMRGLFTCGIIDVLLENDIRVDGAAGVSAGAVFGCNYKSGQIGRPLRYNTRFCRDPRYGSIHSLVRTGDLFEADFCYREVPETLDPFDKEAFRKNPMAFYVGATDVRTGKAVFHECYDGGTVDNQWMRASASMPVVSRVVQICNHGFLDGGIAEPVPYVFMEKKGYERNIIILTQPLGFRKQKEPIVQLAHMALGKYPELVKAMDRRHIHYNQQMEEIQRREEAGTALVIRPPEALNIGHTEKDPEELRRVYRIGRNEAEKRLDEIRHFIETARAHS